MHIQIAACWLAVKPQNLFNSYAIYIFNQLSVCVQSFFKQYSNLFVYFVLVSPTLINLKTNNFGHNHLYMSVCECIEQIYTWAPLPPPPPNLALYLLMFSCFGTENCNISSVSKSLSLNTHTNTHNKNTNDLNEWSRYPDTPQSNAIQWDLTWFGLVRFGWMVGWKRQRDYQWWNPKNINYIDSLKKNYIDSLSPHGDLCMAITVKYAPKDMIYRLWYATQSTSRSSLNGENMKWQTFGIKC